MSPAWMSSVDVAAIDSGVALFVQSRPHRDHSTGRQPRERTARSPVPLKIPYGGR